jgi:predicted  nucleic acid-binding Zn-ribbon protein
MHENSSDAHGGELALAVYLEELAGDRRVLYVASPDGEASAAAAARLAHVADRVDLASEQGGRGRRRRRGGRDPVHRRDLPTAEEDRRWSLIVVPDLDASGLDPALLADLLSDDGVLVAALPADDDAYDALYDALAPHFEEVRMVGNAAFSARALIDFEAGAAEVVFDSSLLPPPTPELYVAVCPLEPIDLDALAVVAVPGPEAAPAAPADDGLREALDAANLHAEELERALTEAKEETAAAKQKAAAALREADAEWTRVEALRRELEEASRVATGSAPDAQLATDHLRLERALQEAGREVVSLQAEVDRRGILVRDLVEELREAQATAAPVPVAPAEVGAPLVDEALSEATERAAEAEAARAELQFRLDEVESELAIHRGRSAEAAASEEVDELRRLEAALRGTVRGLNARLADVIELYQQSQARLVLAEDDVAARQARIEELQREVAETQDQLRMEIARGHTLEREVGVSTTLPGTGDGAQAAQERQRFEARVAELVGESERLRGEADAALAEVGKLRSDLEAARAEAGVAAGEREGLAMRLADREAALAAASAPAAPAAVETGPGQALTRVQAQLDGVRRGAVLQAAELRGDLEALGRERDDLRAQLEQRVPELLQTVAKLRAELAEARADRADRRALESRLEAQRAELAEMRIERASAPPPPPPSIEPGAGTTLLARVQREAAAERSRRRALEVELTELRDRQEGRVRPDRSKEAALETLADTRGLLARFAENLDGDAPEGD